jgi:DNA-binding transcriptional ArsR family regulator
VFKALADPTRRFLLDLLFARDGRTLTELESAVETTHHGVMKHLRVLEDAGLVVPRRAGREKLHFLNPVPSTPSATSRCSPTSGTSWRSDHDEHRDRTSRAGQVLESDPPRRLGLGAQRSQDAAGDGEGLRRLRSRNTPS